MRLFRLLRILLVALRFGLDEFLLGHERVRALRALVRRLSFWRRLDQPRAVRLRLALETLGPIFVKFGQVLSTRRDLLPADIADELAKLQDRVPPFDSRAGGRHAGARLRQAVDEVFAGFDAEPVASASVAQVHFATLQDGTEAAVKVLRPGIERGDRPRRRAAVQRREPDGAAVAGRQAAQAARSGGRVRAAPARRARPDAARPPTPASCAATSPARRCCGCPRCTGTGAPAR